MAKQKDSFDTSSGGASATAAAPNTPTTVPPTGQGSVPAPPKLRRRPVMALAGLAMVMLGALGAAWTYLALKESTDVVAMRTTVMRGEQIGAEDLAVVQIDADPALQVVPGAELESIVGKRASLDLAAGSLLTRDGVSETVVPRAGESVVGLELTPARMPGEELHTGDMVRVVATAGAQNDPAELDPGLAELATAEVVSVSGPAVGAGGQTTVVSVLVDEAQAARIAQYAAAARVAVVLDSRES